MASSSLQSFTVLTKDNDVPGSKFERDPQEYTFDQLKWWLKCRGLKLSGKPDDLVKCVSDCIKSGNHHMLNASIDDGKWFAAKVLKESSELQALEAIDDGLGHMTDKPMKNGSTWIQALYTM